MTIEELHDQLRAAVDAIETGKQWQSWLDFARRLHRYSFHNLMLIMAQRPDATTVASYNTWKSTRRQVRRGERSIKILAPVTRRVEVTDELGRPKLDPDGHKTVRQHVVGFRPASVFDISQTSGPPIPQPVQPNLLAGSAPAGLWDALANEISERGYRLLRAGDERLGQANGLTVPSQREVVVRDNVDAAQAVKSLAHELAHVLLHVQGESDDEPCRGIREVEAESVAYLTLSARGVVTDAYSFPYVALWAYPIAAVEHVELSEIVSRTGQRVIDAARTIMDAIEPHMAKTSSPSEAAVAVRVTEAAERTSVLRDEAKALALPPDARSILVAIVADSQAFLRQHVTGSWVPNYLAERALLPAVNSHGVGYAPTGWTNLTDHLRSLGYSDEHIEAAGMSTRARTGHLIDRMRDRMTLPVRDERGDVVGFTARVRLDAGDDLPKYVNTPTTLIFHKGDLIYRLAESSTLLRNGHRPVITEGPLDAIAVDLAAQQTGSDLVGLATSGTAFTADHERRLSDVVGTAPIYLAFDGDEAGRKAAERAWSRLVDAGHREVKVADLPSGTDPAALAETNASALVRVLDDAGDAAYVLADRKIAEANIGDDDVDRRLAVFRELATWAERLPLEQRVDFVRHLADGTGMDPVDAAADVAERHPTFLSDGAPGRALCNSAVLASMLDDGASSAQTDQIGAPVAERASHRAEVAG
ncbi:toprim domain-containing protein [Microlunatus elymi]|uniref:toprim domain-containing protein n=1 Tax=Microlunatus elymi TaxID=2596828 RepID=UPI00143D8535|nr:toprim domain-containing protein [Microlunatus elymi]